MLQVDREADETSRKDAANLSGADPMRDPFIDQSLRKGGLIPSPAAEDSTPARGAISTGPHGRGEGGRPPEGVRPADLGGDEDIDQPGLLQHYDVGRMLKWRMAVSQEEVFAVCMQQRPFRCHPSSLCLIVGAMANSVRRLPRKGWPIELEIIGRRVAAVGRLLAPVGLRE